MASVGPRPSLSIVIPAFNEERMIVGCLHAIRASIRGFEREFETIETIVVDNNSTDGTSRLAANEGARVLFEPVNRISKARNAGARAAVGTWILFIDADSLLNPALFAEIVRVMQAPDVAAGGALVRFDRAPFLGQIMIAVHHAMAPIAGLPGGPCLFVRSRAFREFGGFREELYGSEELYFSRDAAAWARRNGMRFVVIRKPNITTSGRRFRLNTLGDVFRTLVGVAVNPRSRKHCYIWYDGRR